VLRGQLQEQHWAFESGSDDFSHSGEVRNPPKSTLAQISLGDFYEFGDQSHVDVGFTSCSFIDDSGVPRTDSFLDVDKFGATHVFSRNNLTSASWEMRVSNIGASVILNFFFWDRVS
jgi:hypothetical protein